MRDESTSYRHCEYGKRLSGITGNDSNYRDLEKHSNFLVQPSYLFHGGVIPSEPSDGSGRIFSTNQATCMLIGFDSVFVDRNVSNFVMCSTKAWNTGSLLSSTLDSFGSHLGSLSVTLLL